MRLAFFHMLSMGVRSTRHWETPGRLVQELNICTVNILLIFLVNQLRRDFDFEV